MAWACDKCRRSVAGGSLRSARCDLCDYDICEECWSSGSGGTDDGSRGGGGGGPTSSHVDPFAAASAAPATQETTSKDEGLPPPGGAICDKGHTLALTLHNVTWGCDACRVTHQAGAQRSLRCETCDYDRCENCWPSAPTRQPESASSDSAPPQYTFNPAQPQPQPQLKPPPVVTTSSRASSNGGGTDHPSPSQQPLMVACPKNHRLYVQLHNLRWNCDGCHNAFDAGTRRSLRCDTCDYDLCDRCWFFGVGGGGTSAAPSFSLINNASSSATSNPFQPPTSRPHIQQQQQHQQPQWSPQGQQQQQQPTAVAAMCQKGHSLAKTRHQQQWGCDVCRIMNQPNSLDSMRCGTCDFDICEKCFQKQLQNLPSQQQQQRPPQQQFPAPQSTQAQQHFPSSHQQSQQQQQQSGGPYVPKCRTGHALKQTTHHRSWRCDGCLRTLSSGWEASMHCGMCNYDLCSRCVRPPNKKPGTVSSTTGCSGHTQPPIQKPPASFWPSKPSTHQQPQSSSSSSTGFQPQSSPWNPSNSSSSAAAPTTSIFNQTTAGPGPFGASNHQAGPFGATTSTNHQAGPLKSNWSGSFQQRPTAPTGRCRSLFIGINYPGTNVALKGCWNDVSTIMGLLGAMNFNLQDKQVLVDDPRFPGRTGNPDKQSIIQALHWLVKGAQEGDSLFLHYSGHGSQLKDQDGDEDDGFDETLVPVDYLTHGQIRDDDIHRIVCLSLPAGVRLTAIMDCCHSGTLMDLEYMWVDDMARANNLASLNKRKRNKTVSSFNNRGFQQCSQKTCAAEVVLFSGCKDTQTSADVKNTNSFNHDLNDPGTAGGACTNAMAEIITMQLKHTTVSNFKMSYVQLLKEMQDNLRRRKYTQVPQMSTSRPIDLEDHFSLFGAL